MIEVATASINSFARKEQSVAFSVQPSDQLITLTLGQLQDLISEAVARAQAPLVERIERLEATEARLKDLRARLDALEEGVRCRVGGAEPATAIESTSSPETQGSHLQVDKIVALEAENRSLKAQLESLQELRPWLEALSKKISRLEAPTPSRKTETRAEKIKRYLQERPDHKATYETLRGHLGIDKARLNEAIKLLMATDPGRYGVARLPGDKRGRTLILLLK